MIELPSTLSIEARRRDRAELAWLALYPLTWTTLVSVSTGYWFLPAGLRLYTLLVLRRQKWIWMALIECLVVLCLALWQDTYPTVRALIVATVLPWGIYAEVVRSCRAHSITSLTPQSMSRLLACGMVAASISALILSGSEALSLGDPGRIATAFLTDAVAGFAGVALVVPPLLIVRERVVGRRMSWRPLLAGGRVFAPLLLVALAAIPLPGLQDYVLIFAAAPVVWLSYRFGWQIGTVAVTSLAFGVHVTHTLASVPWDTAQLQLLFALTASASLLIGSSNDALGESERTASRLTAMLSARTQALTDTASRLTSRQEADQHRLGRDLHDELGQDLTAIATHLRLVERSVHDAELRNSLRVIGQLVQTAQEHLRDTINRLHPLVLDRFGLSRALRAGPLAALTRTEHIDYRCLIEGDIDHLPANVATTIYRICQEAATNGVRHGCGGRIHVHISAEPIGRDTLLTLRINDDAGTLDIPPDHYGSGLQGIRDRAHAIGATYSFDPRTGTPRHWLRLILPPDPVST